MADNRGRIWFATFVLVVFCLGGLVGIRVGTHLLRSPRGGPAATDRPGPGPGMFGRGPGGGRPPLPPELINRLATELELDATQQNQLTKLLEDRRNRFEQVHREARERFEREQRELFAEIRAVLRPDQVDRFEKFLAERPGGGRGPRGRGPGR